MKQNNMVIGQKGVKYGLQLPAKAQAQKPAAVKPQKPASVFGVDSDDEEDVATQVARQAEKKRAAVKVQQMYEQALTEDPSVFDYDGVYDSMQQAIVQPKQQDKLERKSKYIATLMDHAEQRKREQDVMYERKMIKERQQEDHLFEDKERFVTSAYRKKLEEDKKWLEKEKQKELEEEKNDVRKIGHMGNFYMNLMSKNVAFGGKAKEGDDKDKKKQEEEDQAADDKERRGDAGGSDKERSRSPSEEPKAIPQKILAQMDQYDLMRLEAEKALRARRAQQQGQEADAAAPRQPSEPAEGGAAGPSSRPGQGQGHGPEGRGGSSEPTAAGGAAGEAGGSSQAANPGGKRRNDDTSVQSARERYLARKAQKTS